MPLSAPARSSLQHALAGSHPNVAAGATGAPLTADDWVPVLTDAPAGDLPVLFRLFVTCWRSSPVGDRKDPGGAVQLAVRALAGSLPGMSSVEVGTVLRHLPSTHVAAIVAAGPTHHAITWLLSYVDAAGVELLLDWLCELRDGLTPQPAPLSAAAGLGFACYSLACGARPTSSDLSSVLMSKQVWSSVDAKLALVASARRCDETLAVMTGARPTDYLFPVPAAVSHALLLAAADNPNLSCKHHAALAQVAGPSVLALLPDQSVRNWFLRSSVANNPSALAVPSALVAIADRLELVAEIAAYPHVLRLCALNPHPDAGEALALVFKPLLGDDPLLWDRALRFSAEVDASPVEIAHLARVCAPS